jgi:hypothetical protein
VVAVAIAVSLIAHECPLDPQRVAVLRAHRLGPGCFADFRDMSPKDPAFDATASRNHPRPNWSNITADFSAEVSKQALQAGWCSNDHFQPFAEL